MLRTILVISIVVILMAFFGWLKFSDSNDQATIILDKQEVKEDTKKAVEKAKEVSEDIQEKAKEALDDVDNPAPAEPARP